MKNKKPRSVEWQDDFDRPSARRRKKDGRFTLLVVFLLVLLLLAGGGIGAYFLFVRGSEEIEFW